MTAEERSEAEARKAADKGQEAEEGAEGQEQAGGLVDILGHVGWLWLLQRPGLELHHTRLCHPGPWCLCLTLCSVRCDDCGGHRFIMPPALLCDMWLETLCPQVVYKCGLRTQHSIHPIMAHSCCTSPPFLSGPSKPTKPKAAPKPVTMTKSGAPHQGGAEQLLVKVDTAQLSVAAYEALLPELDLGKAEVVVANARVMVRRSLCASPALLCDRVVLCRLCFGFVRISVCASAAGPHLVPLVSFYLIRYADV